MSRSVPRAASRAALERFTRTAEAVSERVIAAYSTSFGAATRLLGARHRTHVRNIYALVRVADEIVDGVAGEAGLDLAGQRAALQRYEEETARALRTGYSTDLVVHAFARTAREAGIDESLVGPFFDSMRSDLDENNASPAGFDADTHASYVYGSAEVVGLMCLRVFVRDEHLSADDLARLEHGARRLGAAFQNVNFLRDLADDTDRLGRSYLGDGASFTQQDVDAWVARIREELADAAATIPLLPRDARAAVRSALALFGELNDRIARTSAERLMRTRIRVPDPVKAALISSALLTTWKEGRR